MVIIIQNQNNAMKSLLHRGLVVGLMVVGLGLVVGGSWLVVVGDRYEAAAVIRADPDDVRLYVGAPMVRTKDPNALLMDDLLSNDMLEQVVENLSLRRKWSGSDKELSATKAIVMLRSKTTLQPVRNTACIRIHVRDADPEEAALLANSIAEIYSQWRNWTFHEGRQRALQALGQRQIEGESKIKRLEAEAARLRTTLNVSPVEEPDATNRPPPALSIERANALQPYYDIVRETRRAKDFQQIIERRLSYEEEDTRTPQIVGPVTVMDRAIPPNEPASANHSTGIVLILLGLATFAAGCLRRWGRFPNHFTD